MSQDNQVLSNEAPKASRRAILTAAPAAAAAAALAGTTVALAIPRTADVDPIFAAIDRHREAVRVHEEATARFRELAEDDSRDPDEAPKAWLSRTRGTPRDVAYKAWCAAGDVVGETTTRLLDTPPMTLAGAVAALEWWAEFVEVTVEADDEHDYDFLDTDVHSVFVANIAGALRNIIERGQA